MKFPPAPIISPSWKHLLESKCSSITPPSGGSPHEDNFKPQPTVIPPNLHLFMHSCRQTKIKSKQAVSRRELCPRCTPDTRSLCPGALQHHGRGNVSFLTSLLPHHSFPPFSPVFFQAAWFISSARSSSAQVLAVFTSSLHFPALRTQLAWLISVSFLPTLIPCKLISKLFLELAVHLVWSRAVSELGKD